MPIRPILEPDLPHLLALLRAKAEFDGAASSLRATVESLRGALFGADPIARAGRELQPSDAASRARMNQVIGALDSYGYRPMVGRLRPAAALAAGG